jgi:nucleoside-diphosphate-sugar epimerase
MKLLITGSTGFTGIYATDHAIRNGYYVHSLKSNLLDFDNLLCEILSASPDLVMHLAGFSFPGHDSPLDFYEVNVLGTLNLINSLLRLPKSPSKVLLLSSASVYGEIDSPVMEDAVPKPCSHYGMSKFAMELLTEKYSNYLPIITARPFNYTGRGQTDYFLVPKIVAHFRAGKDYIELGDIKVEREFNDVRAIVKAYFALLEKGFAGETYNVCTGHSHSIEGLIEICKEIMGRDIKVYHNLNYSRTHEVSKLYGNPEKIMKIYSNIEEFTIRDTLKWMLR